MKTINYKECLTEIYITDRIQKCYPIPHCILFIKVR